MFNIADVTLVLVTDAKIQFFTVKTKSDEKNEAKRSFRIYLIQ